MDILFGVISKILEPIIAPINRHIGYVFQFRSNVEGLHDKVELLTVARDSLQCSIDAAESRVEEVEKHVLDWKDEANTAIREAQTPLHNGQEEAQRGCSLRLATRYRISKKAAKTTAGIAQVLNKKDLLGPTIARPRQLHQIDRPVPVDGYEAKSRTKILKEVMGALLDPSITMVGVHGMGGIGKTTLADEVKHQAKSSFDKVIKVTVTATPDVKRIQDKIAVFFPEPKLEDDIDVRASRLHQILENRKVLIIMDDLWSVLDRYEVGIPSWNDGKGCKLLLTSRKEDILSNMGSQKNFPLGFLSKEDSRNLFEKKVNIIEDHDIAEQILAKCDGFPLLIVKVGELIRNKPIHHWKNALTQLSKFQDGEAVEKVHSVLESSYDNLDDKETKDIFLLIGISGKSDTTMLNLLRYALGLGLFKDYTLCEARNRLKKMIDDLKGCSLLEDYEQGNLKMHDLVREIAIRIARRNKYAFRERDDKVLKEWPSSDETSGCTIVSVPQISDIRQLPGDLGCPDVELLLLYFNWHPVDIPDSTFERTRKLKVIHFARMELASLPIRPSHSLANLHTLCLEDCSLLDLTTITQLERLEVLSLRGSDLEALPREIGKLTRMKVLDLSDCSKLISIPLGVISKLTSLEELLMRNSFDNWEVEEEGTDGSNARLYELKCLPRLESLVIRVLDTRALSKDFFFDRLERFQILIGRRWGWMGLEFDQGSEITKTLKLVGGHRNADLFQKVRELSRESEILHLFGPMKSTIHLSDLEEKGFPHLKELLIADYFLLQQVVDCKRPTVYFPLLESLTLWGLTNMVTICNGRAAPESFSQMKRLEIVGCYKLENLFSVSAVGSLPQLEEIIIQDCRGMEALFVAEGNEVVEFPRLRCLDLGESVQLKCFLAKENPIELGSSENAERELRPFFSEKVALPSLETLKIHWNNSIEMIWSSQLASSAFQKLNLLKILDCGKLQKLWPSSSLGRFQNLKSLTVGRCNAFEEIYQFTNGVADDRMILALTELALSNLPRLKRIWKEDSSGRYHSLQNLESVSVSGCESLENLFPPVVAKTLSQLESIQVRRCGKLTQIVAEEEEEVVSSVDGPCSLFPQLTSLTIEDCPKANIFGGGQLHCPTQQPFSFLEEVVPKLKEICIEGRIFKSMSFKYLANLESLRLSSTRGVTAVNVSQLENMPLLRKLSIRDSRITKLWTSGTDEPSSIRLVELERVSGLRHVWRPESQMNLEILKLNWCYDLISLAASPSSASFRRLSTLELCGCDKVTDLVNPTTASTMVSLITLKISRCHYLEEIVAAEEQQDDLTTPECIVFDKLKTLELRYLDSLQGFCISGSYSFKFPCLEEVSVSDCPGMRIFCKGEVSTPKLHNVGSLPLWGSDLNDMIKLQFEDGVHIRYVRLSRYPELVERWGRDLPFKPFRDIYSLEVDQLPLLLPVVAVPSNVLPALSTLDKLVVKKCDSVEEIFDLDGMDHQNGDHVHLMSKLRVLELYELPKLNHTWNKDPLGRLDLTNLTMLVVYHCGTLTHIFTLNVALGLFLLRELYVTVCPRVKVIIEQQSDEQPPADGYCRTIFRCLKKVQLENLPSLMQFFSGDDVLRCPELTSVRVEGCPGMCLLGSTVLSTEKDENIIVQRHKDRPCDVHEPDWRILNMQVEVSRLATLTVEWNSSMGNAWHETVPQSVLHRLKVVKLTGFPAYHELLPLDFVQGMPNLLEFSIADSLCKQMLPRGPKSISETQPAVSFMKLTCLELFDLPELSHLVEEDSQLGSLFQHLKTLKVSKCKRLTKLITFFMAKGLVNLEKLAVEECERITEVVSSNGEEVGVEIVFEKLKSLELHGLPCLASFSSGDGTFNFPRLDEVIVRECLNMKTFAKNAPSTPRLGYVLIAGEEEDDVDPWRFVEAGLNATMEKLFAEKIIHEEITIRRESSP